MDILPLRHETIRSFIILLISFILPITLYGQEVSTGIITVGVVENFPPHYSLNDIGEPRGFAIDIIEGLAERAGYTPEYKIYSTWNETLLALERGEIDLIPNLGITEQRKERFSFSLPVETFPISIFTRDSESSLPDLESLEGKTVAVVHSNIGEVLARDLRTAEIITYTHAQNALFGLLSGNADALIYPEPVLLNIARQISVDDRIKADGPPLEEILRGIAVLKGNEQLLELLNPEIETFLKTDEYKDIYTLWYGKPTPYWSAKRVLIMMSLLLTFTVFALVLWKYVTTEKLVALRTRQLSFQVQLLKQVEEGVISINNNGLITSWNSGASGLLQYDETEVIGMAVTELLESDQASLLGKEWLEEVKELQKGQHHDVTFIRKDGTSFKGIFSISLLLDEDLHPVGFICLIHDITERMEMEAKREVLIEELQNALIQIKTLKGLIPICSNCKKIRDDRGFWNQLESYIVEHSEASFSHGLCPHCAEELYGDLLHRKDTD